MGNRTWGSPPSRWFVAVVLSLAMFPVLTACRSYGRIDTGSEAPDRAALQREDLAELDRLLELDSSYSPDALRAARNRLSELRAAAGTMSPAEFYLGVREISAFADNAHTFTLCWPVYERFGALPIRVVWFGENAHIVRVKRELSFLLGARITHVAGRPIGEVIAALSRYSGGPLRFERVYSSTNLMLSPALLRAAGLNSSSETVSLGVVHLDGNREIVALTADAPTKGYRNHPWMHAVWPKNRPWRYLVDKPIPGEDGNWVALLPADENLPLFLRNTEDASLLLTDIGDGIAYFGLRQNSDLDAESMQDHLAGVAEKLGRARPRHLILDMRLNSGGDLNLTFDFLSSVHQSLGEGGRVASLTGPYTFSAGIYSSYFPTMAAPRRTVLVGSRVGDRPVFWSEGGEVVTLP